MAIGHTLYGTGPERVLIMHDWFSDTSSYDPMRPYMNTEDYTYAFMDLRGYGKSKNIPGECSVEEVARDALELADKLKWGSFHIVGHSMTGMVVQKVAAMAPERITTATAITPVPACGLPGTPHEVMGFLEAGARDNDENALQMVAWMSGERHNKSWHEYKVERWRETSIAEARVAYLHMFVETNFVDEVQGLDTPFLVISGEHDAEAHNEEAMKKTFMAWHKNAKLVVIKNAGHYPMQETPVDLAGVLERFLGGFLGGF